MFKTGDKVVCIKADQLKYAHDEFFTPADYLTVGTVYCVLEMRTADSVIIAGCCGGYYLGYHGVDLGWMPSRFRLVHRCTETVSETAQMEGDK